MLNSYNNFCELTSEEEQLISGGTSNQKASNRKAMNRILRGIGAQALGIAAAAVTCSPALFAIGYLGGFGVMFSSIE